MKVDVLLLPSYATPESFAGRSVVVFDVLRATTTMTAALAAGVREIRVFPDTAAVRKTAGEIGLHPAPLLCGEEKCLAPAGFDLGNSPGAFSQEYAGRTVFMSTTNGTRAILAAQDAAQLFVGALVNASAVAAVLADVGLDVTLLCAGTNGRVAIEDVIGAGAVLSALSREIATVPGSDSARMAIRLFESSRNDLRSALAEGDGGRNVIAAGLGEDIEFAANVDRFTGVVGQVEGRTVRAAGWGEGNADVVRGVYGGVSSRELSTSSGHRRRVVITGIGAVSPNGIGAEAYGRACLEGRSGVVRLQGIDTTGLKTSVAAQVLDFDPLSVMEVAELRRVPRMIPLALAASREAIAWAGLAIDPEDVEGQRQIGCALGTGGGGLAFVEEQYRTFFTEGKGSLFSITAGTHGNLSSELSIALRLRGPSHVLSTGCASSTDAIGYATMLIRNGTVPMMLAGGADAPVSRGILTAFEKMRVVSTRRWDDPRQASRPFNADRDGFVLGEGAWMFVLEDLEHAQSRGVTMLAEIGGWASTCDAYHRVQIAPQIVEPVRAMELAMAEAGVAKDEIGYVNLHGTSTELNDRMETAALKKCFGERAYRIPMSATKSMIGHAQGACGAAGIAATVLGMRSGQVHPTINLDNPDPECDLDYVPNVSRTVELDVALCNCIAFGSKNSAIIVKRV